VLSVVNVVFNVAVAVSPAVIDDAFVEVASIVKVAAMGVACADGTDANRPKPNATTTESAIRLKPVDLLVISFLSIVVFKTFSNTAGEDEVLAL
jgi:hypothetical protein